MENPLRYFADLTDPRVERTRRHVLADIVFIAIASILCGACNWDEMERFGKAKKAWLASFLKLPHGIPSHDTFNRVFQALSPEELERSFLGWVSSVAQRTQGEVARRGGSTARRCAAAERWTASRSRIWFRPGPAPTTWFWGNGKPTPSPTRSRQSPHCCAKTSPPSSVSTENGSPLHGITTTSSNYWPGQIKMRRPWREAGLSGLASVFVACVCS
jgi:hypothetical protein